MKRDMKVYNLLVIYYTKKYNGIILRNIIIKDLVDSIKVLKLQILLNNQYISISNIQYLRNRQSYFSSVMKNVHLLIGVSNIGYLQHIGKYLVIHWMSNGQLIPF